MSIRYCLSAGLLLTCMILLSACGQGINVVDAGTYTGTVDEAVPEEREIYVNLDNGKRLELYFTDQTTLKREGQEVSFSELSQGDQVRVTVTREGNSNTPTEVVILQ